MTQQELGYVFGVSKNTVSGWENAHDTMPFNKLIRFCNLYDFSMDFVVGFTRKNTKYDKIKTDKKKIGSKLKEIRNELNLSQQQLADDCKISKTNDGVKIARMNLSRQPKVVSEADAAAEMLKGLGTL